MIIRLKDSTGKVRQLNALTITEAEQFEGYSCIHLADGHTINTPCQADLVSESIAFLLMDPHESFILDLSVHFKDEPVDTAKRIF